MARKVISYTVSDEGRDFGKVFQLTEMSSRQCEDWSIRVLLAVVSLNPDIPEDFASLGTAALAELGMKSLGGLKWETAQPLLSEMMSCVRIVPDPKRPDLVRAMDDDDIEEVKTRLMLRMEVWKLHMDFLQSVIPSALGLNGAAEVSPQ